MTFISLTIPACYLLLVSGLVFAGKLPLELLYLYMGASSFAFLAYRFDKSAAKGGRWRTPEKTLHLLGLAGGWPGALIAQKLLHHKNRKLSFQTVFWATVVLNCSGIIWLFSSGAHLLQAHP